MYKSNDKISNSLPDLMGQGPQDLRIEGRDSPYEITTRVTLSWESLQSISKDLQMLTEDQRFSLFDRSVFDAVCSLFYSGTVYFTASTSWESLQSISKDLQMLTEDQRFSLFDRSVFDAVCSLFYSGTVYFTASTVFKTMTGKGPEAKVTESQKKAVTESIEKCRYCNITVDFSQESRFLAGIHVLPRA